VHVAHVGPHRIPFWDPADAEGTAERWVREHGGSVHVEKTTTDGWIGAVGGETGAETVLKAIRTQVPCRAWVWEAGPVAYAADGSEVVTDPSAAELRGAWQWDFEDSYTEEASHQAVERRMGPPAQTIARAWGRDEGAVRAAFANARAEALRICGLIPSARAGNGQESMT
jgi:hypothetical protein